MVDVTARPSRLPDGVSQYRRIGPFDEQSLPGGLRREHRLKADVWGLLAVKCGHVDFVWDDVAGGATRLGAGSYIIIPPEVPHHLDLDGPVLVEIQFYRAE